MAHQIRLQFISDGFKEILRGRRQSAVSVASTGNLSRAKANAGNSLRIPMAFSADVAGRIWRRALDRHRLTTDHPSMVAEAENKALSKAVG